MPEYEKALIKGIYTGFMGLALLFVLAAFKAYVRAGSVR